MLTLQEIFATTELKGIISIEDAWTYSKKVEAVLFDLYRMPEQDRQLCLESVKLKNREIHNKINAVMTKLYEEGFNIEGKAAGIIKRYVSEGAGRLIDSITTEDIENIDEIVKEYGLSLDELGIASLKDIISAGKELGSISFRFYADFLNEDKTHMEDAIHKLTENGGYVLCIIDDQLNGSNRAHEIIATIETSDYKDKTICVLLTSNDNTANQKFNNNIFVEFIKKSANNSGKLFENAYLCSLYRIMLKKLQAAKVNAINETFDSAYLDENTANFISQMALSDGALNFDYILKWLDIKEKKHLESKQIEVIKNAIKLSNALNLINVDNAIEVNNYGDEDLYKIDTFDLTVNELRKPIDIGDVFEVDGKNFILIGQECDLAVRRSGERRTEILEFISAELRDKPINYNKEIDHGYEQAIINNFPAGEQIKYISINCGRRYYGKTEIFDMCSFDKNGIAQIYLNDPLSLEVKALISEGMEKMYGNIQDKFENLIEVRNMINNEDLFLEFGRSVGLSTKNNEVIDYFSYAKDDNLIKYNVKRLCRLRKHAGLLHKLYLNHRGRQAEEAVCFSRYLTTYYVLGEKEYKAYCLRSTNDSKNEYDKLHRSHWAVRREDVNEYLMQVYNVGLDIQEEYLYLTKIDEKQLGFNFIKSFDKDKDRVRLTIKKI
ncbi:MAG: hypothetical protein J1G07_04415 [Clostridiales bacterium]|nr:hypothetical protein [Clostridiales bacterium]